ncbi:hypothetical protein Drorol1_Dr00027274 [Drosera rotundifolia]
MKPVSGFCSSCPFSPSPADGLTIPWWPEPDELRRRAMRRGDGACTVVASSRGKGDDGGELGSGWQLTAGGDDVRD